MSTYESNRYAFPASAITSGTFANARLSSGSVTQHVDLSNLNASNLTSGTVPDARVGSSSVNQHVDLSNLNASNLTSGTVPNARISSGSVTQHVTAVTDARGSWSPSSNWHSYTYHQAKYVKAGRVCHISMRAQFSSSSGGGSGSGENAEFYFSGLPFTSWNGGSPVGGGVIQYPGGNWNGQAMVFANSNRIYILNDQDQYYNIGNYGSNGGFIQRNYAQYPIYKNSNVRYIYMNLTYITAS